MAGLGERKRCRERPLWRSGRAKSRCHLATCCLPATPPVDIAPRIDHSERMNPRLLIPTLLLLAAGCDVASQPKKQIETPGLPGPQYVSAPAADGAATPPRPIFDYNVAPAEYNLKPLEKWTEQET